MGTRVEVWAVKRLARRAALVIQDRFHGPIPARAGQPGGRWQAGWPTRAYPRSRGATAHAQCCLPHRWGLSPLARGNRQIQRLGQPPPGPIPARAGQPHPHVPYCALQRAYPRSRGATTCALRAGYPGPGLSPLARGNLGLVLLGCGFRGPIPARAGQPHGAAARNAGTWAYPRSRGATLERLEKGGWREGLSPLARGNLSVSWVMRRFLGPIPARAGQP